MRSQKKSSGPFSRKQAEEEVSVPYIPPNARWYLAELVMQMDIQGDDNPLVHINTTLIDARSPEEAYQKALTFGREAEMIYENTDHNRVETRFRGLRDLLVIHDELEDGAEVMYEERTGLDEAQIRALVQDKGHLAVFSEN